MTRRNRKSFISHSLRKARRLWLGSCGSVATSCGGTGGASSAKIATCAVSNSSGGAERSRLPAGHIGHVRTAESSPKTRTGIAAKRHLRRLTSAIPKSGARMIGYSFAPTASASSDAEKTADQRGDRSRSGKYSTWTTTYAADAVKKYANASRCPLLAISLIRSGHQA